MQNRISVLIIEDENNICDFINKTLRANQYRCTQARTGNEGLSLLSSGVPDVVLLDMGLPDMDGMEVLKGIRSWSGVPVIVISARNQEKEKVAALDGGADDYVTKPFGTSELLARIRTALRHSNRLGADSGNMVQSYRAGELEMDFEKRRVFLRGADVHLTQVEYKIVSLLARNAGKVMTYDTIISEVWGPYADDNNRILRVNMANIRRKLEANPAEPEYIYTELGVGYRMLEEEG